MDDLSEIILFMKRFSFATVITNQDNKPIATHIPVLVREENNSIILSAHVAIANDQWKTIQDQTVLVIFSEPHAYISPTNYERELNVPTWNYLAVHVYGQGRLITDYHQVIQILEQTIHTYESHYMDQWNRLPEEYKLANVKGIVAFEILVTDLQAKKKLSQNKTDREQQKIIDSLSHRQDTNEKMIAEYMAKEKIKNI
mgnify:CR=1 FL=1